MRFLLYSSLLLFIFACNAEKKVKGEVKDRNTYCGFCVDSSDFKHIKKSKIAEYRAQIDDYYHRYFDSLGFNGGFLVAKNGHILYERYEGYSQFESMKKMDANAALHLASVGKVLTATAIFRLIETKKLKLDQKVKSILPQLPYDDITIRMLLNHRSGITRYSNFTEPDTVWGVDKTLHNQDILDLLAKHNVPLDFPSDSKFVYCNTNYALLALVIEKITKMPFKNAMKKLVFDPLGMSDSFVFILEVDKDKVSQSYSSRNKIQEFDHLDAIYGDKNIYSTPRDLLKFDLAMQKDDFISKKLKKEIYKGYSYEKAGVNNYGLGIRLKEWDNGQKLFFHNGWWHGSRASYVSMKDEGVTMIALTNTNSRKVYAISRLSVLFGDYPFEMNDEEEVQPQSAVKVMSDSLMDNPKKIGTKISE